MVLRLHRITAGRWMVLVLFLAGVSLIIQPVPATMNPSAVYCHAMGYQYQIRENASGQIGYCLLPDGNSVPAWAFLAGQQGGEYSYCAQLGYRQKTISGSPACTWSRDCLVCILPTGEQVEVTVLMNLPVSETTCGDGRCVTAENAYTCPLDCPTGDHDGYCDQVADRKCDPDCPVGASDPDCGGGTGHGLLIGAVAAGLIIAAILAIIVIWRRKAG